ncbi:putative cytochrome P450 [Rosa chinensis]|uniref:Putative cytochrome P450 n=1 Tax=Rosa chinensis TaxID=74649 RepID=A0A2P6SII0_ROSCH|nr:putative cytochrome P450 [Rosa chinensis]
MRKITTLLSLHILSNHKLELLNHVRESELKVSTKHIFDMREQKKCVSDKVLVDMKRWFGDLTLNVMFRMVVGKRFSGANLAQENEENECFRKALREFLRFGWRICNLRCSSCLSPKVSLAKSFSGSEPVGRYLRPKMGLHGLGL